MLKQDDSSGGNSLLNGFFIEGCLVQPALNRVTKVDKSVQVQPKIMAVLLCLAEEPGRVVPKERLMKTVWSDTYVTEHVLARAISVLRKLFDDRPQAPRVIETIPKVGYRLIAAISSDIEDETKKAQSAATAPNEQVFHHTLYPALITKSLPWALGLVGLLFMIVVVMRIGHLHH